MTNEEKLQVIKDTASVAAEKLSAILSILEMAEEDTGYSYSYQIKQELQDGYTNTLRARLESLASGDEDDDLKQELGIYDECPECNYAESECQCK